MTLFGRVLVLVTLMAGPSATAVMADEAANEALARRFYTVINNRNVNAYDEFVAADFVDHMALPGQTTGVGGLKAAIQGFLNSSSDLHLTNDMVIPKGDYVTVISTAKGTNDGAMMGMAATNKPFQFHAIDVWLVKDGKLAEGWHVEELLQMMMQLGAMGGGK